MSLLKTAVTSAAVLCGGVVATAPDTADAQIRVQFGSGGWRSGSGWNDGYYGGRSYYGGNRYYDNHGHNDGWNRRGNVWHDTSHYDYHRPSLVPHGNHYDYVPGHYDYHRSGHWH
jgi:hypothetical protein